MRFTQIIGMSAIGLGMLACKGDNDTNQSATYPPRLRNELEQMHTRYKDSFEKKRGLLKRMEVAHDHGAVFDINTYKPKSKEGLFTAIDFDSAGIHTQVFLDVQAVTTLS